MTRYAKGFSLVELMVAMLVGLFLIGGVTQLFLNSKRVYSTQEALSRIQESGRLAIDFITRDLRMAGYNGCASASFSTVTNDLDISTTDAAQKLLYDFEVPVEGIDNAGPIEGWSGKAPVAGTDVLLLRGSFAGDVGVKSNNSSGNLVVDIVGGTSEKCTSGNEICESDILMISDCSKSRVFQATNVQANGTGPVRIEHSAGGVPGNAPPASWGGASAPPSEVFGTESEILKVSTIAYFVALNTANRPALYQKVGASDAAELIEGVRDMQIVYGSDTSGDGVPDKYVSASQLTNADRSTHVGNWESVSSARIQLLLESTQDNVTSDPQQISFNGATINPDTGTQDRKLRQVYVSTVAIRSRLR